MVLGAAIFHWDKKRGPVLETKYPDDLKMSDDLVTKVYMTHSLDKESMDKEELIEIFFNEQFNLSYCDKSKLIEGGYEISILLLSKNERVRLNYFKKEFLTFSKRIFEIPRGEERDKLFLEMAKGFFTKTRTRKLLFLGRPEMGKTSIKRVVFEGVDPKELLANPLMATRGLATSIHSWLDIELSLFDTAGQHFDNLLSNEKLQFRTFGGSDIVIYMIDYLLWKENKELVFEDITKILNIIKEGSYICEMVLFFHKIDLINEEKRQIEIKEIENQIKEQVSLKIYFTSLYPDLIYSLYSTFFKILSSFSEDTIAIKSIIDDKIKGITESMFFLTDMDNRIIVQTMNKDFDVFLVNYIHNLINQVNQTFEEMKANDKIDHFMLKTVNDFNVIVKNVNLAKFNVKNLACISGTLGANKLIFIMGDISRLISNYLYKKGL